VPGYDHSIQRFVHFPMDGPTGNVQ
jgi:hypothetical protein